MCCAGGWMETWSALGFVGWRIGALSRLCSCLVVAEECWCLWLAFLEPPVEGAVEAGMGWAVRA